jgi:histone-lysine N-methyltransferase SETMAR
MISGSTVSPFQKCDENVNSASHCEVLLKLPGQLSRGILLHHDNAIPHTTRATQKRLQVIHGELLKYSPYSPDLAPSDFHLFGLLGNNLGGKGFADDKEVEKEMGKWLKQESEDFCTSGFDALVK